MNDNNLLRRINSPPKQYTEKRDSNHILVRSPLSLNKLMTTSTGTGLLVLAGVVITSLACSHQTNSGSITNLQTDSTAF